jgi:hypothetical protein
MSLEDILFILCKYLDYKSLNILSEVIKVNDYIFDIHLSSNYGVSLSSKKFINWFEKKSIDYQKYREFIDKYIENVKVDNINRIFKFKLNKKDKKLVSIVFTTFNAELYKYEKNMLSLIGLESLLNIISFDDRIDIIYDGKYDQKKINEIGYELLYKFNSAYPHNYSITVLRLYLKKELGEEQDLLNIILDIEDYDMMSFLSCRTIKKCGKFINENNIFATICHYKKKYIYYEYKYLDTKYSFHIIARDKLKDVFRLLDIEKRCKLLDIKA